ncbi:hypothetical protein EVAR_16240_1 [Eumeta japonica]|uniref:Uncharacterized protein n=1 Tax=Eumeta variegata TaxID=151549 RepID=A0A4C1U5R0_EUMVA|nr:hypothetical protein EVAR_16240_1 [Eumeta japonica]
MGYYSLRLCMVVKAGYGRRKMEIQSLRSMCGMSQKVRCKNSDVTKRCDLKKDVVTGVERSMLRWFDHLEGMNESRVTKQIYRANVCDGKVTKGRPKISYADNINSILKEGQSLSTRNRQAYMKRLMDVSEAREIFKDRTMWKSIISIYPTGK